MPALLPDTYVEFEARASDGVLEVRPRGYEDPVFVFLPEDLRFLHSVLSRSYHQDLTWVVVPEADRE